VRLAVAMLEGEAGDEHDVVLEPTLVIRGTTSQPR
jgi:DNA-binding LacI/PurR family transcriptional regulator